MIKINAFQVINGVDEKRISYTYSVLDVDGNILKSNIRKSTSVKETDVDVLDALTKINDFIISKEE